MANFKRKHYKSSTMKKCFLCGSQRRAKRNGVKDERKKFLPKLEMREAEDEIGFPQLP